MKMGIYAMRDVKASAFMQPVVFPTMPLALRWFSDLVQDSQSIFVKHPGDFALHLLGEFDTDTGEVEAREGGALFLHYLSELIGPKVMGPKGDE